jgi:7-carboxy-7-deazaguanine synthase
VWETLKANELAGWIRDSGRKIRLGLQLHKLLWGDVPGR